MTLNEKLKEALSVEHLDIPIANNINWLCFENILKHRRLSKYSLWLTTGKIIPSAGQISPAIAHNGLMKII
ncbi:MULTISPECIES: hypothetical protein [Providencia]|uniref:Uncharacterized protein n=1 Tax=Providencia rustigianii DSM 4541 TaxID=500637 RepID=D1P4V8_9GAMM|nr:MULTISPECIES: hypothetical protein [Providencia]EFB71522.1 hypothetical protein PROVRUST_07262 [Providencia rustigianii DSM 4541]MBG5882309.1 hypothetical protein [Providencia alcalifaciens]MTB44077.1 hypothetical protein [Providencia sp. wls1950]MTC43655.1 hypothetical protein [Providencia sp. wls1921]SUC27221.1 Uncharacterised protein [Providencia rustigianii]